MKITKRAGPPEDLVYFDDELDLKEKDVEDKKKKKPHWTEHFKPIRVGNSPDPTGYYGNYDTNLFEFWDIFKMGMK